MKRLTSPTSTFFLILQTELQLFIMFNTSVHLIGLSNIACASIVILQCDVHCYCVSVALAYYS